MEINYLKAFVVLAQTGNFMEAAEILFSSQSALSKHIKSLETELGVPLFERTTRKVKISHFGELLLPYARQIVEAHDEFSAALQSSLDTERETLTLGSIPALAQYNITDLLVTFKKTRPQSTINVIQAKSEELKEMLREKRIELAFIRYAGETDEDITQIPYAEDVLAAVLPASHPLAGQKTIPLRMLAQESFLLIDKSTMLYRLSVRACKQSGFEPNVSYTDHRLENLFELIVKGMGVSLLMKPLALYLSNPKIAIVDVTPVVSTSISLCHLSGLELSEPAKHFVQCAANKKTSGSLASQPEIPAQHLVQD
jgi:LysR family transcriptional regulator, transcription activator of glutamate synthase operon